MKNKIYYTALLLVVLLTGCYRDDLCFDHPSDARIELQIDWSRAKLDPNAATALIYRDGVLFQTELVTVYPPVRKVIELPVGKYSILVYNELEHDLSRTLQFFDTPRWGDFYLQTIDDPDANRYLVRGPYTRALQMEVDTLAVDRMMDFEVTEEMINNQHVHSTPIKQAGQNTQEAAVIKFYPERAFTLCDIVLKVKNARGYYFTKPKPAVFSGTAQSYYPGANTFSPYKVEHNLKFTPLSTTADDDVTIMMASLQVVGLHEYHQTPQLELRDYTLRLPFTYSGGIDYRDILLPLQATKFIYTPKDLTVPGRHYDHLYIEVSVELSPLHEVGGIDAEVEDWVEVDVPLDGPSYVNFLANNGTKDSFRWPNSPGVSINLPQPLFSPLPGYAFKEWNTDLDGYGASFVAGQEFTMRPGGAVFYAVWQKIDLPPVTLTFYANDGTGETILSQQKPGAIITLPQSLFTAPAGKTFYHWNTTADGLGTILVPGAKYTVPATNQSFYAIWQ